jgi:hypothetical protein
MHPAEVGYISWKMGTRPETAISDSYKVGVSLETETIGKERRIRQPDYYEQDLKYYFNLSEESLKRVASLKELTFSSQKRGFLGAGIEAPLRITTAKVGKPVSLEPTWISLWTLHENTDARPMLERYGQIMLDEILPYLNRETLYEPLCQATRKRIKAAGYDIHPTEVHFIAKLLISTIEMDDAPPEYEMGAGKIKRQHNPSVAELVAKDWTHTVGPLPLPSWSRSMLHMIGLNEDIKNEPVKTLISRFYNQLLADGIEKGFELIHEVIGEKLGDHEEIRVYSNQIIRSIWKPDQQLTFMDIYLPLVLGGVLVDDYVLLPHEQPLDNLHALLEVVRAHDADGRNANNAFVLDISEKVIDYALRKYGFRM